MNECTHLLHGLNITFAENNMACPYCQIDHLTAELASCKESYTHWYRYKEGYYAAIERAEKAEQELAKARREASCLANFMAKTYYPEVTEFSLCDSVAGIITQLDNMVTGLGQELSTLKQGVENDSFEADALFNEKEAAWEELHKHIPNLVELCLDLPSAIKYLASKLSEGVEVEGVVGYEGDVIWLKKDTGLYRESQQVVATVRLKEE